MPFRLHLSIVNKKVPYEKCDNQKIQLEKKYKKYDDCITFFDTIGKGIVSLLQEFVIGAGYFGQLSNGISNSIIFRIVDNRDWLSGGKIYRKYCWDIISIMVAIMSTAIVIYFGEWIKSIIPINLIVLLLLEHVIYIGIRCYVKNWCT